MKAKVFINYRREDAAPYAGRLYDRLTARFGENQVFIDIDQIEPGEDFVEVINRKVSACDIVIVAIGPRWLSATDASGKRRLDDEEDFVRMEIVAALQRKIRIIPVLVGGAQMPRKQDLPVALAPLSRRHAIELSEIRFHADVNRVIEAIEKSLADAKENADSLPGPTTPMESTQRTPAPHPVPSTSLIAALRKPERVILVSAIVLLLLGLIWFLVRPGYQKVAKQSNQPNVFRMSPNPARISPNAATVTANPDKKSSASGESSSYKTLTAPIPPNEKIPPRPKRYFDDYAGVISSDAAFQFNEQLAQFERETSNQVVVAIYLKMESTAPIDGYTRRIANAWGAGQATRANGVILFVFVQDRAMFMQVGDGLVGALPNVTAFDIIEHKIKPHFRNGDYEGGIREGVNAICDAARHAGFRGNGKTNAEPRSGAATSPSE